MLATTFPPPPISSVFGGGKKKGDLSPREEALCGVVPKKEKPCQLSVIRGRGRGWGVFFHGCARPADKPRGMRKVCVKKKGDQDMK